MFNVGATVRKNSLSLIIKYQDDKRIITEPEPFYFFIIPTWGIPSASHPYADKNEQKIKPVVKKDQTSSTGTSLFPQH